MPNQELIAEARETIGNACCSPNLVNELADALETEMAMFKALSNSLVLACRRLEIARVEMGDIAMCCQGDRCKGIVDSAFARMAGVK